MNDISTDIDSSFIKHDEEMQILYDFVSEPLEGAPMEESMETDDVDDADFEPKKNTKTFIRIYDKETKQMTDKIEVVDGEFVYKNIPVVVFKVITSLRTHEKLPNGKYSVSNYMDEKFKVFVIMRKSRAQTMVQKFVNLTQSYITFSTIPHNDTIENSVRSLLNEMSHYKELEPLVKTGFEFITEKSIYESFTFGARTVITVDSSTLNLSTIMTFISDMIFEYVTYSDSLLFAHSMNCHLAMILYAYNSIYYANIVLPRNYFVNVNELAIHMFVSLLMDLFTDRCSKELFIKERSSSAVNILKKYRMKYPKLNTITSESEWGTMPAEFFNELEKEPITLMPYILTYNMSDEGRIRTVYRHYQKLIENSDNKPKKMLSTEEFFNILSEFSDGMTRKLYDSNTFIKIIPQIQNMCMPTTSSQHDDTGLGALDLAAMLKNNISGGASAQEYF